MSQLRRQIAVGAVIAILSAIGLGLGANLFLPPQAVSSTATSTAFTTSSSASFSTLTTTATQTNTATSSYASSSSSSSVTLTTSSNISTTVTTTTTSTGVSTTTYTSTVSSATTPTPILGVNPRVQLDPSLGVSLAQSVLLSSNATQIAEQLASVLGESPVTLTGVMPPHGPNDSILAYQTTYDYSTAAGSRIVVTFVQNVFYQVDYTSGASQLAQTRFTAINASASALKVMAGMGLPTRTDQLMVQIENFSPQNYTLQWGAAYSGVAIDGTLTKSFDGSYFIQGNSVYFEFNPQSGLQTRIILIGPYWYTVGDGFPLIISPLQAAQIAASYAQGLGMSTISEPVVSFVIIHNSLYYAVTVGNSAQQFELIINPRTGEVGLPS